MKKTRIVNFFGSPGTGKTTMAAETFAEMKKRGLSCELVTEFAKMAVWENRMDAMKNEIYLFAKKHHSIQVLNGKVDYIIIDSPLLMTVVYNNRYGRVKWLNELALSEHKKLDNFNVFLKRRCGLYEKEGRIHTEEESREIERDLDALYRKLLNDGEIVMKEFVEDIKVEYLVDRIMKEEII